VRQILQRSTDAFPALAHGSIGQADGIELVLSGSDSRNIYFNLDDVGIDAVNSRAQSFEKHVAEGREYSGE
jgi:hypothetical protein